MHTYKQVNHRLVELITIQLKIKSYIVTLFMQNVMWTLTLTQYFFWIVFNTRFTISPQKMTHATAFNLSKYQNHHHACVYNKPFKTEYKILQKIGDGSFSDVVKCEEIATGKLYAAKVLRKVYRRYLFQIRFLWATVAIFSEKEMRCCAEVKAMQKVKWHPNLIRMLEYF